MASLMDIISTPKPLIAKPITTVSSIPSTPSTSLKPSVSNAANTVIANRVAAELGAQVAPSSGTKPFTQAAKNPSTGADPFFTSPTITLPAYDGVQQNQGRAQYKGLKPNNIILQVVNTGATAGETFKMFDYLGLSGITNGADIAVTLASSILNSTTTGYSAMNQLYSMKNPYFNQVRMSVDNKGQLDYQYAIKYYDENSNLTDIHTFVPSSAIVQEDQQTAIAAMGLEFMVTPNSVFTGKLDANGGAGKNSMTFYTLGYVWDTKTA